MSAPGTLGPNQLAWCRKWIPWFRECEKASQQVRRKAKK